MAKGTGGKDLLLEKGEKIGLGIAVVLGVLFLAFGIMTMFNRPQDPEEFSKKLDTKAGELSRQMNGQSPPIEDIKEILKNPVPTEVVRLEPGRNDFFDPTSPPDSRRIAPTILPVAEAEAGIAVVKILANDFILERNESGEVTKVKVGVITAKTDDK